MKLSHLHESDFGTQFMNARAEVAALLNKLDKLRAGLTSAEQGADTRDLESDKDRGGGVRGWKTAISKNNRRLASAQVRLAKAEKMWEATRSKIGDEH